MCRISPLTGCHLWPDFTPDRMSPLAGFHPWPDVTSGRIRDFVFGNFFSADFVGGTAPTTGITWHWQYSLRISHVLCIGARFKTVPCLVPEPRKGGTLYFWAVLNRHSNPSFIRARLEFSGFDNFFAESSFARIPGFARCSFEVKFSTFPKIFFCCGKYAFWFANFFANMFANFCMHIYILYDYIFCKTVLIYLCSINHIFKFIQ